VLEAPLAKEGLIAAWRDGPDLIIFDPTLPDIGDQEFVHKLRNDFRTARTRLVALSSDPAPARRARCMEAGVDEDLAKSSQAIPALEVISVATGSRRGENRYSVEPRRCSGGSEQGTGRREHRPADSDDYALQERKLIPGKYPASADHPQISLRYSRRHPQRN